jgi:hypothetical protein
VTLALDGTIRGIDVVITEGMAELPIGAPATPPAAYFETYSASTLHFGPGLEVASVAMELIRVRPTRIVSW